MAAVSTILDDDFEHLSDVAAGAPLARSRFAMSAVAVRTTTMTRPLFKQLTELDDLDTLWDDAKAVGAGEADTGPRSMIVPRVEAESLPDIPVEISGVEHAESCGLPRLYDDVPGEERTGATRLNDTAHQIGRLSNLKAVPRAVICDVRALPLDASAGFMLSCIDGVISLEALLDISGMPEGEAIAALLRLLELGAIVMV